MKRLALLCAVALTASSLSAQVLFTDDFESYTDNASTLKTNAGKWDTNTFAVSPSGPSTADFHGGSKSIAMANTEAGGMTASFTASKASLTQSIIVTYWLRDNGASVGREMLQMASYPGGAWGGGTAENILCMGPYSTTNQTQYHARVAYPSATENWKTTGVARKSAWVKMQIEVGTIWSATAVRFFIDDVVTPNTGYSGGATRAYNQVTTGWNSIKIGSVAGTALKNSYIDDVTIQITPAVPVTTSGLWID